MNPVFVTGGTGDVGRPLIEALLSRGHTVHALARSASAGKLPPGARSATRSTPERLLRRFHLAPSADKVRILGVPDIRRLSGEIG